MEKSKKRGVLLRVLSISAIAAITAGIGAGTMARYTKQIGVDGLEDDGNGGTRAARAAAFHFVGTYDKDDSGTFSDATGNISLFSSMYLSSTGRGTDTDGDDVTVKADQQVVAPGTNGALSLKMEAGTDFSDAKKCFAETDTIVKLDISQLETGVYSDAADGSAIPIVYTINGKNYVSSDSNLVKGHTYVFSNNTATGFEEVAVTVDGYLEDLANDNAYYYKAQDMFYKMELGAGDEITYTAADKDLIVDLDGTTGDVDGTDELQFDLDWIWNYRNLGDITAYITAYKADNNGATTAAAITAFNAADAATKATYLTQAIAATNDAWDTALGEAAFARAAGGNATDSDIQLAINIDATQVD